IRLRRIPGFDPRLARIHHLHGPHLIDDPIDKRPRRTRGLDRHLAVAAAAPEKPRDARLGPWPPVLPHPVGTLRDRARLEKPFVQIDSDVLSLHGRPPLTSGAMSFAANMLRRSGGRRPFHLITKNTKKAPLRVLRGSVVPTEQAALV